jgi:hypothetical protein
MNETEMLQNGELSCAPFQPSPNPRQGILVVDDEKDLLRLNTSWMAQPLGQCCS